MHAACCTGCLKKTPLKEMCDFLTLKMLPLALALIKTKICHLFDPFLKTPSFSMVWYGMHLFDIILYKYR